MMLQELVRLANHFDRTGLRQEADYIDKLLHVQMERQAFSFAGLISKLTKLKSGKPEDLAENIGFLEKAVQWVVDQAQKLGDKKANSVQAGAALKQKQINAVITLLFVIIGMAASLSSGLYQQRFDRMNKQLRSVSVSSSDAGAYIEVQKSKSDF